MKFSYTWLQTYFEEPLPAPEVLAEQLTFHSSEIEEIIPLAEDTVIDVKVLPDKSAWLLSHLGLAKEIAVILNLKLRTDPLSLPAVVEEQGSGLAVSLDSSVCDYYAAAYITGVTVQPSPEWLQKRLEAIGQRSINALVDATNYVMFSLGQPLHAFAADKITVVEGRRGLKVRQARGGEVMTTLSGEECSLTDTDTVIVDGTSDVVLAVAGVKGGMAAAVSSDTTAIILEAAHFDRFAIRTTAKRLKLPTDAAKRYENGLSSVIAPVAFLEAVQLITAIAGGTVEAVTVAGSATVRREPVSVDVRKINSVLGLSLTMEAIEQIIRRFGYVYSIEADTITVTPPPARDDLRLPEDLIEEIGRIHGLDAIVAVPPTFAPVASYNARHYYAEEIRNTLIALGFSEVYTSSFRAKDHVQLENALASDKGYLRSTLVENLSEALTRNIPHRDLLGLRAVKMFEIGTVFLPESEEFRVALAVQAGTGYKVAVDAPLLEAALTELALSLGVAPTLLYEKDGVIEFSLDALLSVLPAPAAYKPVQVHEAILYQAFSLYPAISRDIAFWGPDTLQLSDIEQILLERAGDLCVRITHVDTFAKQGRTSYAYRLVFQSKSTTLTDEIVSGIMDAVYKSVEKQGWEVR